MKLHVLTAFPELLTGSFSAPIVKRASAKELGEVDMVPIRNFAKGARLRLAACPSLVRGGMVLKPEPIFEAFESLSLDRNDPKIRTIYMSPQGTRLTQEKLSELAELETVVILCGRYKGVDQRVIDTWIDEEISIGDYVLSGGEGPALVMIDGMSRLVPGVLGNSESTSSDTFHSLLLDYPAYTRTAQWKGQSVPEVLMQGNHKEINEWRLKKSIQKTEQCRNDLYVKYLEKAEGEKNE